MIHTYRDTKVLGSKPSRSRGLVQGAAFPLLVGGLILGLGKSGFSSGEQAQLLVGVALTCGIAVVLSWRYRQRVCHEIRLDDAAGTCDFETIRGVTALHVQQITAVEYDGDSHSEYRVRYAGGRIPVEGGMAAFDDFLVRLTALNPRIDLRSLPARVKHP